MQDPLYSPETIQQRMKKYPVDLYTVDIFLYFSDVVQLLYILKMIPCKENIIFRSVLKLWEIIGELSIMNMYIITTRW